MSNFSKKTMEDLDEIITQMPLEIKRALAIKMIKQGYLVEDICSIVLVRKAFVEKWRAIYNKEGGKDLKPKYKGSESFLTENNLIEICLYINLKETCQLTDLIDYIKDTYNVTYASKQSYYDILEKARMSWKKTEKINPKKDEIVVAEKKKKLKKN